MVAVGENLHIIEARDLLARQRIELDDVLDLVAEEADAPGRILIVGRENLQIVALHTEIAAGEAGIVALILERDQLADDLALVLDLPLLHREGHGRIGFDRPDAIKAGHRRDDDDVVPFEQRAGGRMAHPVDALVHARFFFDIGVGPRHIGFGLIIVVIADEIFDRVVGKEALELAIELGRQDLVGRQDQRGALQRLDRLGHGEGLAGAGDAQQHLIALALARRRHQLRYGSRLVARGFIVAHQLEGPAAFALFRPGRAMRDEALPGFRFGQVGADLDSHGHGYGKSVRQRNRPMFRTDKEQPLHCRRSLNRWAGALCWGGARATGRRSCGGQS